MSMTKEQLLEKYKNLIYKVIKDTHCHYSTDDEFQEYYDAGMLGLIYGINKFDASQQETSTYFINCIKHGIFRFFHDKTKYVRKINYIEKESLDYIDDNDINLHEMIADENVNIENEIIKKEQYEILYKAINMLKPSYKKIICEYYGIGCKNMTLENIAQKSKITRQAVNVKKENALRDLRKNMRKLGGIDIE